MVEATPPDLASIKSFSDGEVVIKEGAEGYLAYTVLEGTAEVVKSSPTGAIVLATLGSGDSFGEISALTKRPATTSVIARGFLSVEILNRDSLLEQLRSDPEYATDMFDMQADILSRNQATLIHHYTDILDKGRGNKFTLAEWLSKDRTIQAFEPDHIRIEQERPPLAIQAAGYLVSAFILFAILWSYFATVDVVVLSRGKSVASHDSVGVHAPSSGRLVNAVFRDGMTVKKGEVLAKVDQTLEEIDTALHQDRLSFLNATSVRLNAELSGTAPERFSENPAHDKTQQALFEGNQAAYTGTLDEKRTILATLEEKAARKQDETILLSRTVKDKEKLFDMAQDVYERTTEVFQRATVAQQRMLEDKQKLSIARLELQRAITDYKSITGQIKSTRLEIEQIQKNHTATLQNQIAELSKEILDIKAKLDRSHAQGRLVEIKAQIDGVIVEASSKVDGSLLQQGEVLMKILPKDEKLDFDVDVSPSDIAKVTVGNAVNIKLDALPFVKHGMGLGRIKSISADTLESDMSGEKGRFYRAKIEILRSDFENTPENFRLYVGMTGSGEIIVGKRRVVEYFIYPIIRNVKSSFREP